MSEGVSLGVNALVLDKKDHQQRKLARMLVMAGKVLKYSKPELAGIIRDIITVFAAKKLKKNEFDAVFEHAGATVEFISENGLQKHGKLIEKAQEFAEVYTPIPLLDHALTILFLAEIAYILHFYHREDRLWHIGVATVIVGVVIYVSRVGLGAVGTFLSETLHRGGFLSGKYPPLRPASQLAKWQEQGWQLMVHVTMSAAALWILSGEPWWSDTTTIWVPHPHDQHNKADIKVYYTTQLAIWVITCFIHRFVDARRKDYFVMYTHHVVTIALVATSAEQHYYRMGFVVLIVHDVSDIFVDLLKLCNYLRLEERKGFFVTEIMFFSTIFTWAYVRLYLYPKVSIHAALIVAHQLYAEAAPGQPWLNFNVPSVPYWQSACAMLLILLCLHIYWFALLMRIMVRMAREGNRAASRAGYEGDSGGEEEDEVVATGEEGSKKTK